MLELLKTASDKPIFKTFAKYGNILHFIKPPLLIDDQLIGKHSISIKNMTIMVDNIDMRNCEQ